MPLLQKVLVVVTAGVSCVGCGFVLARWKRTKAPHYIIRRIITSIALSGLAISISFSMYVRPTSLSLTFSTTNGFVQLCLTMIGSDHGTRENYHKHEGLCYAQAMLLQYFYLAMYLWTACFAFHLYQLIVKRNEYPEQFLKVYRGIGWGVPGLALVYLVLRQLTGHIGVGGADRQWCWIATHVTPEETRDHLLVWRWEGAVQQLVLFHVPIFSVFVFNLIVYRKILKFLYVDPMAPRFREKVTLYLGLSFLCSIWGVVHRLVQFVRANHAPNVFLGVMECICDPMQPLLLSMAYGTNKQSLQAYKDWLCSRWWYSSVPSSDDEESSGLDDSPLIPYIANTTTNSSLDPLERDFGHYFDRETRAATTERF
ncbi:hypothetical protein PsorP6_013522 [Peronosclerospora sorghi]|uniref:Uncharacterized protein n=1 Tax=Peronosclerospora sorghi TaxID=230839 RepID=A0ACC0VG12_9STRA|nr:hypothetical protein PsorP6_013522 [Peronosclerospora sorghi]